MLDVMCLVTSITKSKRPAHGGRLAPSAVYTTVTAIEPGPYSSDGRRGDGYFGRIAGGSLLIAFADDRRALYAGALLRAALDLAKEISPEEGEESELGS